MSKRKYISETCEYLKNMKYAVTEALEGEFLMAIDSVVIPVEKPYYLERRR